MKKGWLLLAIMMCFCCVKKQEINTQQNCSSTVGHKYQMYTMSEMSALMEQMYLDNQRLKQCIQSGDSIGKFPNHFLKIHTAVMTDPAENDSFFKEQAALFIKAQELIYEDPVNAKKHFNDGVDACINCHEVKCGGPITKIRKLYIQ